MPSPEHYYEFDAAAVQGALEVVREAAAEQVQVAAADPTALDLSVAQVSDVTVQAGCINVTVRDSTVCLKLPLGIGSVCLPIPINVVDGTSAQACLSIPCGWGFPRHVCVAVSALGSEIVRRCFA
jgi:hypothetical protein